MNKLPRVAFAGLLAVSCCLVSCGRGGSGIGSVVKKGVYYDIKYGPNLSDTARFKVVKINGDWAEVEGFENPALALLALGLKQPGDSNYTAADEQQTKIAVSRIKKDIHTKWLNLGSVVWVQEVPREQLGILKDL